MTGEVKRRLPRISDPYQLGYSPDGKWFVPISLRLDRVDIYSMPNYELQARIPTAKTPSHVAFARDSSTAYVTMQDSDELVAIDLAAHKEVWRMKTKDARRYLDEPAGSALHRHHGERTMLR